MGILFLVLLIVFLLLIASGVITLLAGKFLQREDTAVKSATGTISAILIVSGMMIGSMLICMLI